MKKRCCECPDHNTCPWCEHKDDDIRRDDDDEESEEDE